MITDLFADRKAPKKYDKAMLDEIKITLIRLRKARSYFNETTDPFETEAVIYRMKELEMHYSFLIKEAKLEKLYDKSKVEVLWL